MAAVETKTRKDQITRVAQNMFSERGYVATSMRDLAREIGIEPASLYSHIKGKEDLLQRICMRIAAEFFAEMDATLNSTAPPQEQFRQAIHSHIKVIANNMDASAVFFNEWKHLTGTALDDFKQQRRLYEQRFVSILIAGCKDGTFRPMDVRFTMRVIFSSLNGTHDWYKPNGSMTVTEVADNITNFLLEGLLNKR